MKTPNQYRGNIILMVLFILTAASAFALLMMQYTQSMFDHTRMMYDYNKAYYLANAGVELGLADSLYAKINGEQLSYAIWYQQIYTDTAGQFGCNEVSTCGLSGTIIARDIFHTDSIENTSSCTTDNAFILSDGASLAFPLFLLNEEKTIENINHSATTITIIGVDSASAPLLDIGATVMIQGWTTNTPPLYDIATYDLGGDDAFAIGAIKTEGDTPQAPLGKVGEYLVFINNTDKEVSFCISSSKPLASQRVRVDGHGQSNDYTISLSAAKKVTIPGFLFSTSVGR